MTVIDVFHFELSAAVAELIKPGKRPVVFVYDANVGRYVPVTNDDGLRRSARMWFVTQAGPLPVFVRRSRK